MKREYLLTSESVSEGHPDKMADQISDAILDVQIDHVSSARVACETLITKGMVIVAGEIDSGYPASIPDIVRWTIKNIGYTDPAYGFDYHTCVVILQINQQSSDISAAVIPAEGVIGAGDQGSVFGYATSETPELMPLGISLAHRLVHKQAELRKNGTLGWLRPDAKSQVTVRYIDAKPVAVEKVVLSTQHSPDVSSDQIESEVVSEIIEKVVPRELRARHIEYLVNPAGRFVIGGPEADTGLTGRKIMVDTYGPSCPHGGGAFSGKDPTKVDRSGAYMARYIAKNIVAAGLAERCTVQLSYAIGKVEPVSLMLDLHGTGRVKEQKLMEAVRQIFNPTPKNMIQMLDLHYPIYRKTAVYGHFGRELPEFTWEMTDQVDKLTDYFGIRRKATGKDKSRLPVETDAERYRRIFAGITINYDELRQFHTSFTEERLREITRESDIKFATDFKKFMNSEYVQNRVIIEDHWTQHYLFIKYSMIPQITEKMKGKEHTFKGKYAFMNDSPSTDVCLQLLRKDSDKYILITKTPNLTDPKVFQDKIGDIYPGCKTLGNPFHNGSTNSGQMYIAVIHFVRKYFAPSQKCPYSHITVHRMDTGMETSRIVARFEDGEELSISDNS